MHYVDVNVLLAQELFNKKHNVTGKKGDDSHPSENIETYDAYGVRPNRLSHIHNLKTLSRQITIKQNIKSENPYLNQCPHHKPETETSVTKTRPYPRPIKQIPPGSSPRENNSACQRIGSSQGTYITSSSKKTETSLSSHGPCFQLLFFRGCG